jgi:hypothetical protein
MLLDKLLRILLVELIKLFNIIAMCPEIYIIRIFKFYFKIIDDYCNRFKDLAINFINFIGYSILIGDAGIFM